MEFTREAIELRKANARKGIFVIPDGMQRATAALFWERRLTSKVNERGITPIYNLSERDGNGTLSMYQIYMQCATEYEAAIVLLGTISHWRQLCTCNWFIPYLTAWREEMAIRDIAIGRAAMLAAAANGNYAAGKALVTHTQKVKEPKLRGTKSPDNLPGPEPKAVDDLVEGIAGRAAQLTREMSGGNRNH